MCDSLSTCAIIPGAYTFPSTQCLPRHTHTVLDTGNNLWVAKAEGSAEKLDMLTVLLPTCTHIPYVLCLLL